MSTTTIERAMELTEGVLEETDNSDHKFKLRTAIQLLEIIKGRHDAASDVLADCKLDEQVQENLQELGYLE
jgi:tellurite resistance protein